MRLMPCGSCHITSMNNQITKNQIETPISIFDLNGLKRDKNSFAHAHEITKPFGGLDAVLKWCKAELQDDWRWQLVEMSNDQRPGRYIFYFDSEKDYLAFLLKWG